DLVWSSGRDGGPGDSLWESVRASSFAMFPAPHELLELGDASHKNWNPSLSADGLDILWSSDRAGGRGGFDIYTAHRPARDQPFGAPRLVPELSSQLDDIGAHLSADGATVYLNYAANTGGGNADIDTATRTCM